MMWAALVLFACSMAVDAASLATCPLQGTEPSRSSVPFDTCTEFSKRSCCSYGETEAIGGWLREEKQSKYNVSVPFRVQSTIDVSSPRVLVRECGRILEQVGCAKSCSPDSSRFVETTGLFANSFWICPEYCEEFFQYCVDVTEQRFVNAQTFCEQQRLDNGLQVRVRDFSCYSAGRLAATPDQSFAYGRALYGGAANQLATFYVQAVDRFGNYKTRGGDAFIPSLFDSRGVPTPIKIVDNDDGTYTVTFSPKPDTYTIDVTLNGASIRNVPRKATFGGASKCILPPVAGLLPKPQPDLATCVEFSGNACCDNFILRPWGEAFESVYVNYAGTPVCKSAIDHLLCGIPCSPTQSRELRLNTGRKCPLLHEDDDDGGVGGEKPPYRITDEDDDDAELEPDVCEAPVLAILTVCRDYCRRVYEACSDCKAADRGVTVASAFDTQEAFCRSLAPKGYRIEVGSEPNCFGSSQDASLSGSFAQLESVSRARVGTEVVAIVQAADDNGNYVLEGGSEFTVRLDGVEDDPRTTLTDDGNGRYSVRFFPTAAGTYDLHVYLAGQELAQSPFSIVIWPGEVDPTKSSLAGPAVGVPVRAGVRTSFIVGARDSFGNDMLIGDYEFTARVVTGPDETLTFAKTDLRNGTTRFSFTPPTEGVYVIAIEQAGKPTGLVLPVTVRPGGSSSVFDATRTFASGAGLSRAEVGTPATFVIKAGDTDGVQLARGGERFDVRITGRDAQTLELVDVRVPVADNDDGTYTAVYVLLASPGPYVIDVSHVGTGARIRPTPSVLTLELAENELDRAGQFSPANSSADLSTITSPAVGDRDSFKITSRNAAGVVLTTGGVQWRVALIGPQSADPASRRTTFAHVTDNLDGTYTASFVPIEAGEFVIDIRPQGVSTTDPAFAVPLASNTITVAPDANGGGMFDIAYSTVTGAGVSRAVEGRNSVFTIVAKDKFAVQMSSGGLKFSGVVAAKDGSSTAVIRFVDNNDGTYSGMYQLSVGASQLPAGWAIQVQLDGADVYTGDVRVLEAATGAVSVAQSQALGTALRTIIAGRTQTVIVLVNDANGAPFVAGGVNVVAEVQTAGEMPVVAKGDDRGDGSYELRFRVETPGVYQLRITIDGAHVPNSPFTVNAAAGTTRQPTPFKMRAELDVKMATMSEMERMVHTERTYGRAVPELASLIDVEAQFVVRGLADDGAEMDAIAEDVLLVEMRSAAHRYRASVTPLGDGSFSVAFTPRSPGRYEAFATFNGVAVPTPIVVVVRRVVGEGEFDAAQSFAFGHVERVAVGELSAVSVVTVDYAGLPMASGGERFVAHVVPRVERADAPLGQPFSVPLRDNGDGTYTMQFAPHVAVAHIVTIEHVETRRVVPRTPFVVSVSSVAASGADALAGVFSPAKSTVDGDGLVSAVAGRTARFTVRTRDANRHALQSGGLRFAVRVAGPVEVEPRVTDNGDGTYTVEYQTPRAGQYVVSVRTPDAAHHAIGAHESYSVGVLDWLAPAETLLVGNEQPLLAGTVATLTVVARDVQQNPIITGGLWLAARVTDEASGAVSVAHVTDNGDGTYALRFVVPDATVDTVYLTVTVAGAPLRREPFALKVVVANAAPIVPAYEYTTLTDRFGVEPLDAVHVHEGVATRVALHVRDAAKQPLSIGGDVLRASIVAKDLPGTTVPRSVPTAIVDNGDGSYLVDVLVSNFVAGAVHWFVRVERVANGAVVIERPVLRRADAELFRAAPLGAAAAVSADADAVKAAASYAFGALLRAPIGVGASVALGVQPMADSTNAAPASAELAKRAAVVLRGSPASGVLDLALPVTVSADGATLVVPTSQTLNVAVGVYLAHVTLDGAAVRASPYAVRVVPPHFAHDSVFAPLATLVEAMEDAQGAKFTVQTRDGAGRKLQYGGLRFGAVLRSPSGVEHRADVHDNNDGSYTLIARASETGAHELTVHSFDGATIVRRQVTVTPAAANDCPHFWQTLGVGSLFSAPNDQSQFFLKPCDCDGKTIASTGIDVTDSASVSAIEVALLGPSGAPLESTELFEVGAAPERATTAPFGIEEAGDGSFIVGYRGDVCGPSQISVRVYGSDVAASPHRLQFTDEGAGQCSCPGRVTLPVALGAGSALCSAHGVCRASTNTCVCEVGWSGADCATQPPPVVERATFSSVGDRIAVVFARNVQYVGANASEVQDGARFDCAEVLTDVATLGSGAVCYFNNAKTLVVVLGSGATIVPTGAISVRGNAVANEAGVKPTEGSLQVAVGAPAVPAVPVVLVEAPSVIHRCTTGDFVAQATTIGLAGRAAQYRWTPPRNFAIGPSQLGSLVESERTATLTLTLSRLVTELQKLPGAAQEFQVCATSFLGAEDCTKFTVTLQIAARSDADIAGPNELRVAAGTPVTLKSAVTLRDGECQPAGADVRGVYLWRQTQGPALPNDGTVSLVGTEITLPAHVLEASTTYRFELSVTPQIVNSRGQRQTLDQQAAAVDYVSVVVGNGAALAARIVPSGARTHPRSAPIKLDGSRSLLSATAPVTYEWQCYSRGDVARSCWTRGGAPGNSPQLELPSNALLPDTYTFVLTVRQGEATSSAQTEVTVLAEEVPVSTVRALGGAQDDVVNNHEPLTLVGTVTSVRGRETTSKWDWSPPLERESDVAVNSTSGSATLQVPPGSLTPGVEYTFVLLGDDGAESRASRVVRVNQGPRNGNCTLVTDAPVVGGVPSGLELNSTFAIDCATQPFDDVAEDLPLTYYATYVRNNGLETSLLAAPLTTPVLRDLQLPDGEIELFAYVIDAQGAATRVRVSRITVDNDGGDHHVAVRHKQLQTALDAHDWDRAVQVTNVLLLDDTSDAGCIAVAERVRDDFRPAASPYASRTVATWVERQSATCNATTELRDAHLAILDRVAKSGTTSTYTPLGARGESVANRVAAGAAAVIGRSNDIGGNVLAGEQSTHTGSSPESAASVVALTRLVGAAQCDELVAGAPATVIGVSGSAFSMRVQRFQTPVLATELVHGGAKVLLPSRADALVLAAGAREVCTLHAVYQPSPFGLSGNISSPVSFVQLVRADVATSSPPLNLEPAGPQEEARKRQASDGGASDGSDRVIDLGTLTVPVTVTLKQDARALNSRVELRCVSFRNNAWVDQGCRNGVKNVTANGEFVCVCDQAGVPVATQLPPPVNLPPGAGVQGARQLPLLNGQFVVNWLAVILLVLVGLLLLCCFFGLWYLKRNNLRYEYLEKQRQKELEEAGAAVDYAQYKSELSGEDASLVLRKAEIEISESVTSTSQSSRSSSELGGRGDKSSKSSSSQSELGRTTESSSGSELGQARGAGAKDASSSGTGSSRSGGAATGGKKASVSKSSSVSETTSSSLSKSGSDSEVLGEASHSDK